MNFLKIFTNRVNTWVKDISFLYTKLKNFFYKGKNSQVEKDNIKTYHHQQFSYIFISTDNGILGNDSLSYYLNFIKIEIQSHLQQNNSVLINAITKVVFEDDLNIIYTRSLTVKELFKLENFEDWSSFIKQSIKNLLIEYKDSKIKKIEFRFDYINSKIQS